MNNARNEIARTIKQIKAFCRGRSCLKKCIRDIAATAPRRGSLRVWRGVVAAISFFFFSIAFGQEFSGIRCIWDDGLGRYFCSGEGSVVEVIGGGGGAGVVSNMYGSCTNCVDMTPEECTLFKLQFKSGLDEILVNTTNILENEVIIVQEIDHIRNEDIANFRRFGFQTATSVGNIWPSFTNYVSSVNNTQTRLDRAYSTNGSVNGRLQRVAYNDGIYDYAQSLDGELERLSSKAENIGSYTRDIADSVASLSALTDMLDCEVCSGGACSNDCNGATGGRWCTEEQGDAITNLLFDIRIYVERLGSVLLSISNNVESAVASLQQGFFTPYTHIPTEEDLGMRWQDLYLEGYSDNFEGYANTNILARIELLLAGMSGVLTNYNDYASAGDFAEEGLDSTNALQRVFDDHSQAITNAVQDQEANIRSVGSALVDLYQKFREWVGVPFSTDTLLNSYTVEFGDGGQLDIPSMSIRQDDVGWANLIRVVCRSVMSVVYIFITIAIFVRFHIAYFQWLFKYVKWLVELLQGLFA